MHYIEKYNYRTIEFISLFIIGIILLQPNFPISPIVLIPAIVINLSTSHKLRLTIISSIILGFFFQESYFQAHTFSYSLLGTKELINKNPFLNVREWSQNNILILKMLAFIIYSTAVYFFVIVCKKIFKRYSVWLMMFLVVSVFGFFYIADAMKNIHLELYFVLMLIGMILSKTVFYIFNYLRFFIYEKTEIEDLKYLFIPAWFLNFEIPENPNGFIVNDDTRKENAVECFRILVSSVKFKLLVAGVTVVFGVYLDGRAPNLIFGEGAFINNSVIPLIQNWKQTSTINLWLSILFITFAYVIASFHFYSRIMIAIAKFCGFNIPDYINKPWKCNSFADFFSRTMFYYNIIVINLFFYPILEFSRSIMKNRKTRIVFSLFLALIIGGFITRFAKDVWKFNSYGFSWSILSLVEQGALYNIVLAFFVCVSVYFGHQQKESVKINYKYFLYFVGYSLIMTLNLSRLLGDSRDLIKFYGKLFFLNL